MIEPPFSTNDEPANKIVRVSFNGKMPVLGLNSITKSTTRSRLELLSLFSDWIKPGTTTSADS